MKSFNDFILTEEKYDASTIPKWAGSYPVSKVKLSALDKKLKTLYDKYKEKFGDKVSDKVNHTGGHTSYASSNMFDYIPAIKQQSQYGSITLHHSYCKFGSGLDVALRIEFKKKYLEILQKASGSSNKIQQFFTSDGYLLQDSEMTGSSWSSISIMVRKQSELK